MKTRNLAQPIINCPAHINQITVLYKLGLFSKFKCTDRYMIYTHYTYKTVTPLLAINQLLSSTKITKPLLLLQLFYKITHKKNYTPKDRWREVVCWRLKFICLQKFTLISIQGTILLIRHNLVYYWMWSNIRLCMFLF